MSFLVGSSYPRGTWFGNVDFAHHLTQNYGPTLEIDDFEDFLNYRNVIASELDLFISSNTVFAEAGIHNFHDFEAFRYDSDLRYESLGELERSLRYALLLELGYIVRSSFINEGETVDLVSDNESPLAYTRIRSFDNIVGTYQTNILRNVEWPATIDSFIAHTPINEREARRLNEIRNSDELKNIIDHHTIWYTWQYGQRLAILTILVTLILVSSLITTDRAKRVNWLQYTSKQGRSILKKQFIAILISSVSITTILIIIFAGIFSINETHEFWNNGINSFLSSQYHWLSITYGQYVLLIAIIIYLMSIGAATFVFALSRYSQSLIQLMFKVTPFFFAALMLSNWILSEFLGIFVGGNVFAQMLSLALSLFAAMAIAILIIRREKRVEIVV